MRATKTKKESQGGEDNSSHKKIGKKGAPKKLLLWEAEKPKGEALNVGKNLWGRGSQNGWCTGGAYVNEGKNTGKRKDHGKGTTCKSAHPFGRRVKKEKGKEMLSGLWGPSGLKLISGGAFFQNERGRGKPQCQGEQARKGSVKDREGFKRVPRGGV